jgi:hypothetical protein
MSARKPLTIDHELEALVAAARSVGAPEEVAVEARRATMARFVPEGGFGRMASPRVESYFWGVIRRRALKGGAPAVARLIVAASLAAELEEAGHRVGASLSATT